MREIERRKQIHQRGQRERLTDRQQAELAGMTVGGWVSFRRRRGWAAAYPRGRRKMESLP